MYGVNVVGILETGVSICHVEMQLNTAGRLSSRQVKRLTTVFRDVEMGLDPVRRIFTYLVVRHSLLTYIFSCPMQFFVQCYI